MEAKGQGGRMEYGGQLGARGGGMLRDGLDRSACESCGAVSLLPTEFKGQRDRFSAAGAARAEGP